MPEPSPADWYPDPFDRYELRYWDGHRWTDAVASRGRQAVDPPARPPTAVVKPRTPAAWHPDPYGRHEQRYWDGSRWTDHVATRGLQGIEPPPGASSVAPVLAPSTDAERQPHSVDSTPRGQGAGGPLFTEPVLIVNQKAKLFGSTLGYAVFDQYGQQLGTIQEQRRDLGARMSDSLLGRGDRRAYRFQVVDTNDRVVLAITRPQKSWKSAMVVEGPNGVPIGQILQETTGVLGAAAGAAHVGLGGIAEVVGEVGLGGASRRLNSVVEGLAKVDHIRFGLEAGGQRLGSIKAEDVKAWDFRIEDAAGAEVARVTKTWAGWAKERFTRADNYVVQLHRPLAEPLRSLVLAAALAVDVALKQGEPTRGSSWMERAATEVRLVPGSLSRERQARLGWPRFAWSAMPDADSGKWTFARRVLALALFHIGYTRGWQPLASGDNHRAASTQARGLQVVNAQVRAPSKTFRFNV